MRLESEKERDRVAAQRREDEMSLAVVGDIVPRFREVCKVFVLKVQVLCFHTQAIMDESARYG